MFSPLKKHIDESPKLRELRAKRERARKRLLILCGILFFVLLGGFIFFAHYPKIQIENIVVSGNQIVETEDITNEVNAILDGNYFYVIPHRNAFFYPKEKIVTDLANSFLRLKNISVYRTSRTQLSVSVTERRGYALWCGSDTGKLDMNTLCWFTDETGKIISTAPYYSGNVYPRFFGGALADADPLGRTFIDQSQFQQILSFLDRMSGFGFQVKAVSLASPSEYDFVLDLGGQKSALVRFPATADYQTLADNLALALSKKELADKLLKNKSNLEYFDLRFSNKVYYKFAE